MSAAITATLDRLIAALTYDSIEQIDIATHAVTASDGEVPLLQRSIAQDLRDLEGKLGTSAKGQTILSAIAASIDEALLAAAEARLVLGDD